MAYEFCEGENWLNVNNGKVESVLKCILPCLPTDKKQWQ
jgi:hypothetical protein